jgi:hypothetical protein
MELIFSLVLGVLFTFLLFMFGRKRRPIVVTSYFIVLFLLIWAGGIWLRPMGPELWGVRFLNFLIVGSLATLFLLALFPARENRQFTRKETMDKVRREALRRTIGFSPRVFIAGVIVAILITMIVLGYVMPRL